MALVVDGYDLVVQLIDNGADESKVTFKLTAADYTTAIANRTTILGLLAAVTNAVVKGHSLIERYIEDNLIYPGSGVEVENRAKVNCNVANNPTKVATLYIPAPRTGIFQGVSGPSANIIDAADADLNAYIGIWQETGGLAAISDGEFLTDNATIRDGERTHRRASHG